MPWADVVRKGAVHVARADPSLYRPVPPGELIERMRSETGRRLNAAEEAIADYMGQTDTSAAIWDIQGRDTILVRARQLVEGAIPVTELVRHDLDLS